MSSLEDIFQTNKVGREYVQLVQYVQRPQGVKKQVILKEIKEFNRAASPEYLH